MSNTFQPLLSIPLPTDPARAGEALADQLDALSNILIRMDVRLRALEQDANTRLTREVTDLITLAAVARQDQEVVDHGG